MALFAISIPEVIYHIFVYALPLTVLAVLYGLRWKVGLWGNALSLGAVLFSALIAVGYWEDLAYLLAKQFPGMLFFADCVAFWAIFLVSLVILDSATRTLSKVKVKYSDKVESIGNGIILALLFVALYGTYLFVEEIGPVGAHKAESVSGNSIPVQAFRILSNGNLAGFSQTNQFDSTGNFRELHLKRRKAIMSNMQGENGTMQGPSGVVDGLDRKVR